MHSVFVFMFVILFGYDVMKQMFWVDVILLFGFRSALIEEEL